MIKIKRGLIWNSLIKIKNGIFKPIDIKPMGPIKPKKVPILKFDPGIAPIDPIEVPTLKFERGITKSSLFGTCAVILFIFIFHRLKSRKNKKNKED